MTYSGTFKTRGEMQDVEIKTTDDFQTITIIETAESLATYANTDEEESSWN